MKNYPPIFFKIVFLLVVLCATVSLGAYYILRAPSSEQGSLVPKLDTIRRDLGSTTPEALTSIPLEKGVHYTQSYTVDNGLEAGEQSSVVFESQKTLKQNYTLYKGFLESNKWEIFTDHYDDKFATLYGINNQNEVSITLRADGVGGNVEVSLNFLKK